MWKVQVQQKKKKKEIIEHASSACLYKKKKWTGRTKSIEQSNLTVQ